MNKKTIKAVRIVCGYTDDLRHKLPYSDGIQTPYERKIFNFLLDNMYSIFSADILERYVPEDQDPDQDAIEYTKQRLYRFIDSQTRSVCLAISDKE